MTVGDLLSRITSREITEWMAFFAVEHRDAEMGTASKHKIDLRDMDPEEQKKVFLEAFGVKEKEKHG